MCTRSTAKNIDCSGRFRLGQKLLFTSFYFLTDEQHGASNSTGWSFDLYHPPSTVLCHLRKQLPAAVVDITEQPDGNFLGIVDDHGVVGARYYVCQRSLVLATSASQFWCSITELATSLTHSIVIAKVVATYREEWQFSALQINAPFCLPIQRRRNPRQNHSTGARE